MRVFHVISGFEGGGVETLLLRLIEKIPPETDFHVIAHRIDYAPCAEAFRQLGVTIHLIPCRKHYFAHQRALCRLFLQYRPDVVHVHTTEWGYLSLRAAKKCGVPFQIQHSHAAYAGAFTPMALFRSWAFWLGRRYATDFVACGKAAARSAFGEKNLTKGRVLLLYNGIDTGAYAFSTQKRETARNALGIREGTKAVLMAARFSRQKNHKAALSVFENYFKKDPDARLFFAGEGETLASVRRRAEKRLPAGSVVFLGMRSDLPVLYSGMDLFLLSSRFEGLPISLIEAQAAGLPAVVPDTVSAEAAVTDLVSLCPLSEKDAFCRAMGKNAPADRGVYAGRVAAAGFDLCATANRLLSFYRTHRF